MRVSQGMVRCGTCRERFQVDHDSAIEKPVFDPRTAFIEPLSESIEQPTQPRDIDNILSDPEDFEFQEISTNQHEDDVPAFKPREKPTSPRREQAKRLEQQQNQSRESNSKPQTSSEKAGPLNYLANDAEPPSRFSKSSFDRFETGFDTELSVDIDEPSIRFTDEISIRMDDENSNNRTQHELDFFEPVTVAPDDEKEAEQNSASLNVAHDKELIDEMDQLIEDKLLEEKPNADKPIKELAATAATTKQHKKRRKQSTSSLDDSLFEPKKKSTSLFKRWIISPILLLLALLLTAALVYQLWLKQLIEWPDRIEVQNAIIPLTDPLTEKLAELKVDIPVRRNLSQLELLSARTEAHSTRSSTVLLRVSMINHADIEQPLPWIELSLTDADGRLVSRRSLAPQDYVHNNRTDSYISAKELKKITIELLTFPKQATGYELKLLNK